MEIPQVKHIGKDLSEVDRPAEFICCLMAKSVVKSGLSKRYSVPVDDSVLPFRIPTEGQT